jgi:hypothetical protein
VTLEGRGIRLAKAVMGDAEYYDRVANVGFRSFLDEAKKRRKTDGVRIPKVGIWKDFVLSWHRTVERRFVIVMRSLDIVLLLE